MRDPYEILGVARGASFDEIKAAYRQACKSKHPDMGGSHEEFVELQAAYEYVLNDLKRGYQQQRKAGQSGARTEQARDSAEAQTARNWEKTYRDIDDELEELRRAARAHEEALRNMRARAWDTGDRATWAKLTWDDFARFIREIARSGLKGLALLFAALIGIGSVFIEANVVSAMIVLGSGIGFFFSVALKNDKGGFLSAGLLLFGLMTIWLPPIRAALLAYPIATISVLICLALIFKFAQAGGTVGLMTGGVLSLYVIGVIVEDTRRVAEPPFPGPSASEPTSNATEPKTYSGKPVTLGLPQPAPQPVPPPIVVPPALLPPPPPEPRTLIAAQDAVLKFVTGVTYHLKIRTGFTTTLYATQGSIALFLGEVRVSKCERKFEFSAFPSTGTPYQQIEKTIRSCGGDAIFRVDDMR